MLTVAATLRVVVVGKPDRFDDDDVVVGRMDDSSALLMWIVNTKK